MAVADELRRVSIRAGDRDVDLVLPAHLPLRDLLPAVVDLIADRGVDGRYSCLQRVWGEVLDPVRSLAQCDVRDGEMLILTAPAPAPAVVPVHIDPSAAVAAAVAGTIRPWAGSPTRTARRAVFWWAASMSVVLLARPVFDGHAVGSAVAPAVVSVLALGAAAVKRRHGDSGGSVPLGLLAAGFAGVAGLLAAPGRPGLPGVFLAISAAAAVSLLAWRLLDCATWVFLPIGGAGMAASVVSVGAVAGWWAFAAAGPALVLCALAVLVMSPRLVVRGELSAADPATAGCSAQAGRVHRRLTVLVLTGAAATAVGVVFTAAGTSRPLPASGLVALAGVVTLLRAGAHREPYRVVALGISTAVSASVLVVMVAVRAAPVAPLLGVALMVIAVSAVRAGAQEPRRWPSPAQRAAAVLDLAAIVTAGPLTAITAGVLW